MVRQKPHLLSDRKLVQVVKVSTQTDIFLHPQHVADQRDVLRARELLFRGVFTQRKQTSSMELLLEPVSAVGGVSSANSSKNN